MTDFRFDDIVECKTLIGKEGRYAKCVCKSCSNQYKVTRNEFEVETLNGDSTYIPSSIDLDILIYVAKMRAWNCCYENETPIDGFPEKVESMYIKSE